MNEPKHARPAPEANLVRPYTLTAGRGKMVWAVLWGMVLELTMLATYPSMFTLLLDWAFVVTSSIGHLCYGLALGATARRVVKW